MTCRSATEPGKPAPTGSTAGDATGPGIGYWHMSKPARMRSARWFGRSAWTVPPPAHTSMPVAPVVGPARPTKKGVRHPVDEGLGRSQGGLTTKFHLACDGRGRPLSIVITLGQRHDSTQLELVLAGIRVPQPGGRAQRDSLQTRDTATHAVVACCASGRSRTRSLSDAINAPSGRRGQAVRSPSTGPSTPVATWSSAVSIGSNSGVDSPRATRSARSTTGPWSSSPPLSSGSNRDSSDRP